jgi:capsular exopolysaccharide synthesis family protein
VFHTDPYGLTAEQFRLLRRTLSQESATGAVLMITSPGVGDGKTLTSLNLCTCLADSGEPTLLVEADVRRPTVGRVLGCAIEPPGIEDALAGNVEPSKAIHLIEGLSFHAAMVAQIPSDPSRLVNGAMVRQFLAWAREHFRWVVLDAAPVLPAADVSELLNITDGAILVIRAQSTPRELSKRAIEVLGKRLYGVIFNEVTIDASPYYRYLSKYNRGGGAS